MNKKISYEEFEKIFEELGTKKISELSRKEISKYLLLAEELDWMDCNIGDDKVLYTYNRELLDNLSYTLDDSIFRLIQEELLYDNNLHCSPKEKEEEFYIEK